MRHRLFAPLLLLALVPCPRVLARPERPAGASKEEMMTAKRHFESGEAFFRKGNYDAARMAFEEAYRLSRLPDLLFNLALVARAQERFGDAIGHLEEYLLLRPDAADRQLVETQIDELKQKVEEENRRKEEQERARRLIEEQEAARAREKAQQERLAAQKEPQRGRLPPWPALAIGGSGLGMLIIGIALGGAAMAAAKEVDAGTRFDRDLHERGQALESAAIAFDVLGVLALGAGGAWSTVWYLRRKGKEPATLSLLPRGLGLAIGGAF